MDFGPELIHQEKELDQKDKLEIKENFQKKIKVHRIWNT
jgi:hypothetical protein